MKEIYWGSNRGKHYKFLGEYIICWRVYSEREKYKKTYECEEYSSFDMGDDLRKHKEIYEQIAAKE